MSHFIRGGPGADAKHAARATATPAAQDHSRAPVLHVYSADELIELDPSLTTAGQASPWLINPSLSALGRVWWARMELAHVGLWPFSRVTLEVNGLDDPGSPNDDIYNALRGLQGRTGSRTAPQQRIPWLSWNHDRERLAANKSGLLRQSRRRKSRGNAMWAKPCSA